MPLFLNRSFSFKMSSRNPAVPLIVFKDVNIAGRRTFKIAQLGVGYVPEDRRVFPNLTVLDNLEIKWGTVIGK